MKNIFIIEGMQHSEQTIWFAWILAYPLCLRGAKMFLDKLELFMYNKCINTNNTVDTINTEIRKKGCE